MNGLLLLSVVFPLLGQEPELLPPAPAGWRFERIDFPLDFAPDIEHEGFEELWFAPGMFAPESDTFSASQATWCTASRTGNRSARRIPLGPSVHTDAANWRQNRCASSSAAAA